MKCTDTDVLHHGLIASRSRFDRQLLLQRTEPELPVYNAITEKTGTKIEKHYYMVLTLAEKGVLACVALKSGTRNLQNPGKMTYWFDRLVEFGLGEPEDEAKLRATVWKVRTYNASMLASTCCNSSLSRLHHSGSITPSLKL